MWITSEYLIIPISIHSLRVEGDHDSHSACHGTAKFQSTPSEWRETKKRYNCCIILKDFNPLPPSGGRLEYKKTEKMCYRFQSTPSEWRETLVEMEEGRTKRISIHSLRVEGDTRLTRVFNAMQISIHSLRVEGDVISTSTTIIITNFNPLPPSGGRL